MRWWLAPAIPLSFRAREILVLFHRQNYVAFRDLVLQSQAKQFIKGLMGGSGQIHIPLPSVWA